MSRDLPEMMSTDYVQRMQQWVGDSTEGTSQDNLQNLIVWKRTDSLLLALYKQSSFRSVVEFLFLVVQNQLDFSAQTEIVIFCELSQFSG